MKNLRYIIPEISAQCILSSAEKTEDGYTFSFDTTDPSKEYLVDMTTQDDCAIFYQAMCVLHGDNFKTYDHIDLAPVYLTRKTQGYANVSIQK